MAEELNENVAPVEETEVKAEATEGGEKSAANAKGAKRFGNGGRRFNRDKNGRGRKEEKLYEERVIKISRVAKTVKGGKRIRFTALVVIGDGKGKFGYGLGKSNEVPDAIKKALAAARKNLGKMFIAKGDTITHAVMGHFGATQVFLKPAPAGTGLVAGGAVRSILELAGIKNVYSKIYGARTQGNVVKATIDGLKQLKTYEQISETRYGKKVATSEEAK
jgi:small subunit ribosomal protein S5